MAPAHSRATSVCQRLLLSNEIAELRHHIDTDQVALTDSLVIQNQGIGVATTAQGFQGVDGILGIGPVDLTEGTVGGNSTVDTVTDNLFAQGTISSNSIGIFYEPTTSDNAVNGELTFGGVDASK